MSFQSVDEILICVVLFLGHGPVCFSMFCIIRIFKIGYEVGIFGMSLLATHNGSKNIDPSVR